MSFEFETSQDYQEDEGVGGEGVGPPTSANRVGSSGSEEGWFLDSIDVENFKSYKGVVKLLMGPSRPFVSIVGPNGSGKSNLMDAISFVMGERTNCLRVRRLNELIHGASIGRPIASQASVSALFKKIGVGPEPDGQKRFTRMIRGASSEYSVNGEVVSQQNYFDALKALGINAKGKNFLVFQGAIENVAMKNAKERTALLEEICGSGDLKSDYENCKAEITVAERKFEAAYLKKKGIIAERREVKMEMQEAKVYGDYLKQVTEKEIELYLFMFFHIDKELQKVQVELRQRQEDVELQNQEKQNLEEVWKVKKKERAELTQTLSCQQSAFHKLTPEKSLLTLKLTELKEKVKHLTGKLITSKKSLKHAENNKINLEDDIRQNQMKLWDMEKERSTFLGQLDESQSAPTSANITFRDSQMDQYWNLKKEVLKETQKEKKEAEELERRKKDKIEVLNSLTREKTGLVGKLNLAGHGIKENEKLSNKILEKVDEFKELLKNKMVEVEPLRGELVKAEEQVHKLQEELESITRELESAKTSRHEESRRKRRHETLAALQMHFKGVKGRVATLCKPRHGKYKIPIARILGKYMETIVVDTEVTARQCVRYLKEQMIEPEVFLPLDLLAVRPLCVRLRGAHEGVHLAYDLLEFNKDIEKAILHCVSSTVICRTSSEASQIASGELLGEATTAVSEDGTLFAVSGIISGGKADLQRKVQRWDDNALESKEQRRLKIREEIKELIKTSRKKVIVEGLEQEIGGLRKRLQFAESDYKSRMSTGKQLEAEKRNVESELGTVTTRWNEAEKTVADAERNLGNIEAKINVVEDNIFASFCEQVNIGSIREYEDRDVRVYEEHARKKAEFQSAIQVLKERIGLDFEQLETHEGTIKRWLDVVSEIDKNLATYQADEVKCQGELTKEETRLSNLQKELNELTKLIDLKSKEIGATNKKLVAVEKLLMTLEKGKSHLQTSLVQTKLRRHDLFKQCKIDGVQIPFESGSLEDISFGDSTQSTSRASRPIDDILEDEDELQVKFDELSAELRRLEGKSAKETEDNLTKQLQELQYKMGQFQALNLKVDQKWDRIQDKVREQQDEFDELRKQAKAKKDAFEKVKRDRLQAFMQCFEKISGNIDKIYKSLTQSESAQAVLGLENPEEPYLDGVTFHCVPPGKRFQSMSNLSGGERTLAALALLFAIHR